MKESAKFEVYEKKLQGVCEENNLMSEFSPYEYPLKLTVKPTGEGAQISFAPKNDIKETSPEAFLQLSLMNGEVAYEFSDTFIISEALLAKLKRLFKNLCDCWLQYFFRETIEKNLLDNLIVTTMLKDARSDDGLEE